MRSMLVHLKRKVHELENVIEVEVVAVHGVVRQVYASYQNKLSGKRNVEWQLNVTARIMSLVSCIYPQTLHMKTE